MAAIFYKYLLVFSLFGFNTHHPIFVSVTEIEHNVTEKTLEVTCKIFTDDFESTLRKNNPVTIDLLDPKYKSAMNPLVEDYVQKHLSIISDGKKVRLKFLGYEQDEEGIISFFEAKNIEKVNKMEVINNILYEAKPQQMGIIHVMVNGARKSSRLNNPDTKAEFSF